MKINTITQRLSISTILALLFTVTSIDFTHAGAVCGKCSVGVESALENLISKIDLDTETKDNADWIDVSIDIGASNFTLDNITIPLSDSGSISINSGKIILSVNLTKLSNTVPGVAKLPNNTPLPGALSSDNSISTMIAGNVYLYYKASTADKAAMIGVAVPVKTLEQMGINSTFNFFTPFQFNDSSFKISGNAGIFNGAGTETDGLAIFMNYSK